MTEWVWMLISIYSILPSIINGEGIDIISVVSMTLEVESKQVLLWEVAV